WNAHELLAWLVHGGGYDLYNELLNDVLGLNVVGFFLMPMPCQPLGWFKFHPKTADDLKNLKYRTVGLATNVMQAMGLKVTQLPGGEIVPAMEKGVIEAFEYNNPTSDSRFGAQDVANTYMLSSYHQSMEVLEIEFNKDKFNSLGAEQQAILKYAVEAASSANLWFGYDNYAKDLQKLIRKDKVKVHRTSESILKAQLAAWDQVVEQYSKDDFFKKVIDSQRNWARDVAYYELLNAPNYKLAYDHYYGKEQPLGF
ncbi:MAG TPA: C4-dicarboxylate ABC transporter, partial [Alphaproteobacteria bacterium]|nr:C4-dicarboxylate ABC transporter [Alphaproteobacteria bacterium]